ncbi:MAG: hypothetical protein WC985_07980, partial [Thermoplasmata archaeon]
MSRNPVRRGSWALVRRAAGPRRGWVPTGTIVVTVENRSAADETVQLLVNGVSVSTLSVPARATQQASVGARLASPFGSMVKVQAVTVGGRRAEQAVFVG